jgi:hypothetical protein
MPVFALLPSETTTETHHRWLVQKVDHDQEGPACRLGPPVVPFQAIEADELTGAGE